MRGTIFFPENIKTPYTAANFSLNKDGGVFNTPNINESQQTGFKMHESMFHVMSCVLFGHETRTRTFRHVFAALQFSHKIFMQNRIYACNFLSAMKV